MRTLTRAVLGASALASLATGHDLAAQATMDAPLRSVSFGLLAGINVASISGDDTADLDSRTGFLVGGFATYRLTPMLAVQPELLFVQKGASGAFEDEDGAGSAEFRLYYVEIPLLLRVDVPGSTTVRPFLLGGPAIGILASCDVEGSFEGMTASFDCDDVFGLDLDPATIDLGALIGGGLEFPLGTRALSVGVRYTFGLNEIFPDSDSKNRSLGIVAGLRF